MIFSIDWLDDAENASAEERATVGDLRLYLNAKYQENVNVTLWESEEERSDHLTIAMYGLVHGLVHDWWSVLGKRDGATSIQKFRTGYLVPDIRMSSDGEEFKFACCPGPCFDSDIRFTSNVTETVSRKEGVGRLENFVEFVIDRLDAKSLRESGAKLRWQRIKEAEETGERSFCEAYGALGLDPYDWNASENARNAASFVERAETVFAGDALVDFAACSKGRDQARLMAWVNDEVSSPQDEYLLADLHPIVMELANGAKPGRRDRAWKRGYRMAKAMRKALGLSESDKLDSFEKLAKLMGAPGNFAPVDSPEEIVGLRRKNEDSEGIHVTVSAGAEGIYKTANQLFALARVIGDAACFSISETSVVNRLTNAYRQAAGRAFAAEFLAPVSEVLSMLKLGRNQHQIADEFGVAPIVIGHQIENRKRIAQSR